ncbi:MAG: hypothetical protein ACOH2F_06760 [Cellulomonas sp.]
MELVADISELGDAAISKILERVIGALRPASLVIDGFGPGVVEGPVAEARDALIELSGLKGGAGIKAVPSNHEMVRNFVTYAPHSAAAEIEIDGPTTTLVELNDGEWIGISMTDEELSRAGLSLDPTLWKSIDRPNEGRWWRRPKRGRLS